MVHDSYVDQVVARVESKMLLHGLAPHTVATYIPCVRRFIAWVRKPLGAVKCVFRSDPGGDSGGIRAPIPK